MSQLLRLTAVSVALAVALEFSYLSSSYSLRLMWWLVGKFLDECMYACWQLVGIPRDGAYCRAVGR